MITKHKDETIDIPLNKWVLIYNEETLQQLVEPFASVGGTYTCADATVVADTLEECYEYIQQNNIVDSNTTSDANDDL
jgi:hypothetical protein